MYFNIVNISFLPRLLQFSWRSCSLAGVFLLSVSIPSWAQSVLYCETFGNDKAEDQMLSQINTDWRGYRGREAQDITEDSTTSSSRVISSNFGYPRNVPNEGTPEPSLSEQKGFVFQRFDPGLFVTTSFEIDPSKYSSLRFNWHAANSSETDGIRLVVRVGDAWYVSDKAFTTPASSLGALSENVHDFEFTTKADAWRHLDFVPNEMLAVGETCTLDLPSGQITGFGLLIEGDGGNKRFDTFSVLVSP